MKANRILAVIPAELCLFAAMPALAQEGARPGIGTSPSVIPADSWITIMVATGLLILAVALIAALFLILQRRIERARTTDRGPHAAMREECILQHLNQAIDLPSGTRWIDGVHPHLLIRGKWLGRYVDRSLTPLRWHSFVRHVGLPLCAALSVLSIVWIQKDPSAPDSAELKAIVIPYRFADLFLMLIAWVSFARWHRAGVFCYLSLPVMGIVWYIGNFAYRAAIGAAGADTALNLLMVSVPLHVVAIVPLFIYYRKRALLFSPRYRAIQDALHSELSVYRQVAVKPLRYRFRGPCPVCGARTVQAFDGTCPSCGALIDRHDPI